MSRPNMLESAETRLQHMIDTSKLMQKHCTEATYSLGDAYAMRTLSELACGNLC